MLASYVLETSVAPGTAITINLAGAATDRVTFASQFATGSNVFYFMDDGTQAEWGIGVSTTSSPNTLSRNTVLGNTAGTTSRLNFTGTVRVYNEVPGGNLLYAGTTGQFDARSLKLTNLADGAASGDAVHFGQFAQSLGAGGFIKLPGGLLLAWGNATTNAGGSQTVALPFGNACFGVIASVTGPTGTPTPYSVVVSAAPTKTAFSVASVNNNTNAFQGNISFYWFALGD